MNPGPLDEAGKAASGFMDAMKTQPLSLALVVMNIALLALFYVIIRSAEGRQIRIVEQQKQLVELLAQCRGVAQ
jgi:branched-subunit amino acid ABC-type transport system permease component